MRRQLRHVGAMIGRIIGRTAALVLMLASGLIAAVAATAGVFLWVDSGGYFDGGTGGPQDPGLPPASIVLGLIAWGAGALAAVLFSAAFPTGISLRRTSHRTPPSDDLTCVCAGPV